MPTTYTKKYTAFVTPAIIFAAIAAFLFPHFVFAQQEYDLSDIILEEEGISVEEVGGEEEIIIEDVPEIPRDDENIPAGATDVDEFGDFTPRGYLLLEPLDDISFVETGREGFSAYANRIFTFLVGIAGVLAVAMIVWGGMEYMVSEAFDAKTAAKNRMTQAVWGLLLVFGSWLILNTINPNLLEFNLNVPELTLQEREEVEIAHLTEAATTPPIQIEEERAARDEVQVSGVLDLNELYETKEYQEASASERRDIQRRVIEQFETNCEERGGEIQMGGQLGGGNRWVCRTPLASPF